MTTTHVDGRFAGAGGGQIYWQGWAPEDVAGVVVIVHGLAEHGGRYWHVATRLAQDGYASYVADHRGHGKSDGVKGNINRMSEVVTDLETMVRGAAQRHPDTPMFLYGHSMGGLVALSYLLTARPAELHGAVITSAAIDLGVGSAAERLAARALSRVTPNLGTVRLDASTISRDPEVVRAYDEDPLNYRGKTRVRTAAEMLAAIEEVTARLGSLTLPLLILHGTADRLTGPAGARLIADRAGSTDVTLTLYDGWFHELHNEPERETVFAEIVRWLKEHA